MSDKKYLTLKEASEQFHIPISTLRKRIEEGRVPKYKPGRNILVDAKDIELLIKRSRVA